VDLYTRVDDGARSRPLYERFDDVLEISSQYTSRFRSETAFARLHRPTPAIARNRGARRSGELNPARLSATCRSWSKGPDTFRMDQIEMNVRRMERV